MVVGGSSRGPWGHQVSLLVPSRVSELFSRWSEAVPEARGGTRFLYLFLHLFQSSSHKKGTVSLLVPELTLFLCLFLHQVSLLVPSQYWS